MVVIALFLLVVAGAGAGAQGGDEGSSPPAPAATGEWVPIGGDVIRGDGLYRQVARFALVVRMLAFGAAEGELTLVEVVAGSVQAAGAGNNYRLLLRAAGGGGVGTYEAVVWGVPGSTAWTWKVLSFRRVAGD
ncbi:hypothetical protein OsI_06747 [Oryza sativa Indica Group]|uniref:Cysteine proteinase inhibitor n=2 Tax=Oryza TaxID=4527 RepID=A0A0E0H9N4_ORYNI|nr:hypothetical protein OsI_06747 [Oryza sativa Indica Group]